MGFTLVAIIILQAVSFEEKIIYISVYVVNKQHFPEHVNKIIVDSFWAVTMWQIKTACKMCCSDPTWGFHSQEGQFHIHILN